MSVRVSPSRQYLHEVEQHLDVTIQQIGPNMDVQASEFDGKVAYGEKRGKTARQSYIIRAALTHSRPASGARGPHCASGACRQGLGGPGDVCAGTCSLYRILHDPLTLVHSCRSSTSSTAPGPSSAACTHCAGIFLRF